MTPEKIEEILENNRFEPVKCFRNKDYKNVITLTIAAYGLNEQVEIVFTESDKTPRTQIYNEDAYVELEPEVSEAIAYCITHFENVWEYFYYKGKIK